MTFANSFFIRSDLLVVYLCHVGSFGNTCVNASDGPDPMFVKEIGRFERTRSRVILTLVGLWTS